MKKRNKERLETLCKNKNEMQSPRKPKGKKTMKTSVKDNAKGRIYRVKGKIKEIVGKIFMKSDLEAEGKEEGRTGKVPEKIGEIKKAVGK